MIEFDENGFVKPYRPVLTDLTTLEEVFVLEFPTSTTRRGHFEQYREYNSRLLELLLGGFTQWVDGSFVSRKLNPNDIDVLTFFDHSFYYLNERKIRALKEEFANKAGGRVHAHPIRVYPESHPLRHLYESDRVQWLFDWSRTTIRPRKNKGLIELIIG